jgi:DNA-binding transcriptional ArsR family regulator
MKVSLSFKGDDIKTARPIAQIGAIYSDNLTYDKIMIKRTSITQDKALTILKLLSDKSKLEILQLTRDEAYYGAQLANKIGLTTATISHHTSALFEQSLLQIEKVDSKIFYKQNQETIKSLIKYLEDTLLK